MAAELAQIAEKLRNRGDGELAQHFDKLAKMWPKSGPTSETPSGNIIVDDDGGEGQQTGNKGIKGWMRDTAVAEEISKARGEFFLDHTKLGLTVTYHPDWQVQEAAMAAITDIREHGNIALSNTGMRHEAVLRLHQSGVNNTIDLRRLVDQGELLEVKGVGRVLEVEIRERLVEFEGRYATWKASLKPQPQDTGATDSGVEAVCSSLPKWECPECGQSVRVGIRGDLDILCGPCTRAMMKEVHYTRSIKVRKYTREAQG